MHFKIKENNMQPYACFILLIILFSPAGAIKNSDDCHPESGRCNDKSVALRLKVIAMVAILVSGMIGVCLPLFSRSLPVLQPDRNLFTVAKAFAGGVILATGYMHVLPDSFELLNSKCLPENPWRKFPFTSFVAMLSAVGTLMVDSLATSFYKKLNSGDKCLPDPTNLIEDAEITIGSHGRCSKDAKENQLLRHRIISQVLELGIVVHSVVIGLSLGTSQNPCTIKPLVAALCFHQLFEGIGLGGCILQAEYTKTARAIMVFFFSVTTPVGIAVGIGLSNIYKQNSSTALIVVGILNASSSGLLNYMALVDILAEDFMGPKLQSSPKLQLQAYLAVLLGAGGMSLMAKWA